MFTHGSAYAADGVQFPCGLVHKALHVVLLRLSPHVPHSPAPLLHLPPAHPPMHVCHLTPTGDPICCDLEYHEPPADAFWTSAPACVSPPPAAQPPLYGGYYGGYGALPPYGY